MWSVHFDDSSFISLPQGIFRNNRTTGVKNTLFLSCDHKVIYPWLRFLPDSGGRGSFNKWHPRAKQSYQHFGQSSRLMMSRQHCLTRCDNELTISVKIHVTTGFHAHVNKVPGARIKEAAMNRKINRKNNATLLRSELGLRRFVNIVNCLFRSYDP